MDIPDIALQLGIFPLMTFCSTEAQSTTSSPCLTRMTTLSGCKLPLAQPRYILPSTQVRIFWDQRCGPLALRMMLEKLAIRTHCAIFVCACAVLP